jgi:tRNA pseudouridine55 synthase
VSASRPRIARRAVHGVLLLDKPLGLSSNDALQKAKRLFRAEKAGHTGTLDPLATGLLPICFGAATKFSQVSLDADKAYRATVRLGQTSSTFDGEGDLSTALPVALDRARIDAACVALTGMQDQMPPMHSALKKDGKALYEYARAGVEVERAARRITIHAIDVVDWHDATLVIDVRCTKGTYIRTLAHELGQQLGCGAWLAGLRRTGTGPLAVEQAVSLEALAGMTEAARDTLLRPADCLLAEWPQIRLDESEAGRFLTGLRRRVDTADLPAVRVYGPQPRAFLGSAHIAAGELIADRLLSPLEVRALIA